MRLTLRKRLLISSLAVIVLMTTLIMPEKGHTLCKGTFINPVTDVCWHCMFPMKIAGMEIMSGPSGPPDMANSPICVCPFPPPIFIRIGIPVSFWEPARYIETVKDPFCFPGLGFGFSTNTIKGAGSSSTPKSNTEGTSSFQQAHYAIFPIYAMMELFTDFICVEHSGFDMAYITEVDPLWNDDILSFIIQPESLLFANPIAQLACVADSIAANVLYPIPFLFWCMGSSGSAYPLTGHIDSPDYVQVNHGIAARMIYKLGREGLLWDPGISLCAAIPSFIWTKWNYRLQIVRPIRGFQCPPIGRSSLVWGIAKNPPIGIADNFLFMVFRKRVCCAF